MGEDNIEALNKQRRLNAERGDSQNLTAYDPERKDLSRFFN